jgi:DNA-binding XRE family transcriptional regulator
VAKNLVEKLREELLMSKAELARKARVSAHTIDRIEEGMDCRIDTKRKIILALGYDLAERKKVFPDDEDTVRRHASLVAGETKGKEQRAISAKGKEQ